MAVVSAPAAPAGLAPDGTALAPVTVGNITLPAGSTPQQRFEARLKASGLPSAPVNTRAGMGPPLHIHATPEGGVSDVQTGETAAAKAPPSPKQLEKQNKPQDNVAAFDQEMRSKGLQTGGDVTLAPGQFDQEAHELITEKYKAIAAPLVGKTDQASIATAERFKAAYLADIKSLYEGRQLTAGQKAELRKSLGKVDTLLPKSKETPAPAPTTAPGWQSHIEDGEWVGLEHLTTADTHGFKIKQYVKDQRVNVAVFERLKQAKAWGFSQAEVDAVFDVYARQNGWTKAS